MNKLTLKETWDDLCKEYGTTTMELCFSDFQCFKKYVAETGLLAILKWLDTPEPDWQRDC